jgi:AraC-like DNA-binding protein/quercetin dioxygenase-like cupin family protein
MAHAHPGRRVEPPINSEYFAHFKTTAAQVLDLPLVLVAQDYAKGVDTGLHRHEDFYALYIVSGGRGIHVISGHPYHVARGDVYIALPGSYHAYRDFENLRADCFCFTIDLFGAPELEALRALSGLWSLQVDTATPNELSGEAVRRHRLHLAPERHAAIEAMVRELWSEAERAPTNPAVARILLPALFFRLLVTLARDHEATGEIRTSGHTPGAAGHDAGLAAVLRLCETHFAEPLSVPQLAATMFLSPGRFSEVFSQYMGVAPATYLRRLRLERAQTLLRTSRHLPAATIATQVGFNNPAQFSRAFRAAFGVTPSEYRSRFGA